MNHPSPFWAEPFCPSCPCQEPPGPVGTSCGHKHRGEQTPCTLILPCLEFGWSQLSERRLRRCWAPAGPAPRSSEQHRGRVELLDPLCHLEQSQQGSYSQLHLYVCLTSLLLSKPASQGSKQLFGKEQVGAELVSVSE